MISWFNNTCLIGPLRVERLRASPSTVNSSLSGSGPNPSNASTSRSRGHNSIRPNLRGSVYNRRRPSARLKEARQYSQECHSLRPLRSEGTLNGAPTGCIAGPRVFQGILQNKATGADSNVDSKKPGGGYLLTRHQENYRSHLSRPASQADHPTSPSYLFAA